MYQSVQPSRWASANRQANHARRHDKKAKLAKFRATFRKVER